MVIILFIRWKRLKISPASALAVAGAAGWRRAAALACALCRASVGGTVFCEESSARSVLQVREGASTTVERTASVRYVCTSNRTMA
eukprot:COSAG03_NODE_12464_length_546_cov_1.494407_1_plen_85_part_10